MVDIALDGLEDGLGELFAKSLTLLVDVAIVAAAEIDAFEGTGGRTALSDDLFQFYLTVVVDDEGLTGL